MSTKSKVASSEEAKPSRRKFFIGASAAIGAVAVVSQTPAGKAVIQEIGSTVKDKGESKTMTAHMRKYYESTML
jgi:serine acetyltransferase